MHRLEATATAIATALTAVTVLNIAWRHDPGAPQLRQPFHGGANQQNDDRNSEHYFHLFRRLTVKHGWQNLLEFSYKVEIDSRFCPNRMTFIPIEASFIPLFYS